MDVHFRTVDSDGKLGHEWRYSSPFSLLRVTQERNQHKGTRNIPMF